jgi:hypothetical protein
MALSPLLTGPAAAEAIAVAAKMFEVSDPIQAPTPTESGDILQEPLILRCQVIGEMARMILASMAATPSKRPKRG